MSHAICECFSPDTNCTSLYRSSLALSPLVDAGWEGRERPCPHPFRPSAPSFEDEGRASERGPEYKKNERGRPRRCVIPLVDLRGHATPGPPHRGSPRPPSSRSATEQAQLISVRSGAGQLFTPPRSQSRDSGRRARGERDAEGEPGRDQLSASLWEHELVIARKITRGETQVLSEVSCCPAMMMSLDCAS